MSYLIAINERTNEVLHPEVVKLSDTFSLLSHEEMLYVVLYADYNSLYKQFPEHERKRRAMWHAFNENAHDVIETPRVLAAIKEYTALQFDPDRELITKFQHKIDSLTELLEAETTSTGIEKTVKAINALRANIKDLQSNIDDKTRADGVIKGDRQLSFLEKLKSNKKRYEAVIAKK